MIYDIYMHEKSTCLTSDTRSDLFNCKRQTNYPPTNRHIHHAHAASPLDPLDTPVSLNMADRTATIYANR